MVNRRDILVWSPAEVSSHINSSDRNISWTTCDGWKTKFHTSIASLAFKVSPKREHESTDLCWNWGKTEIHVFVCTFTVVKSSFKDNWATYAIPALQLLSPLYHHGNALRKLQEPPIHMNSVKQRGRWSYLLFTLRHMFFHQLFPHLEALQPPHLADSTFATWYQTYPRHRWKYSY